MPEEQFVEQAPRPPSYAKTPDHGIVTYIHGVSPIRRNEKGDIRSGEVEQSYAKYLTKILGLGNIDEKQFRVLSLVDREIAIWKNVQKRGVNTSTEDVIDGLLNIKHTILKTSNSLKGFSQKQINTQISVQEATTRFNDMTQQSGGSILGKLNFLRGRG